MSVNVVVKSPCNRLLCYIRKKILERANRLASECDRVINSFIITIRIPTSFLGRGKTSFTRAVRCRTKYNLVRPTFQKKSSFSQSGFSPVSLQSTYSSHNSTVLIVGVPGLSVELACPLSADGAAHALLLAGVPVGLLVLVLVDQRGRVLVTHSPASLLHDQVGRWVVGL